MPAKVKVRILAGRNLPVMDKSSDASDAFVEVKLGNTTYKTEVYRRSLNPFWNSEWFRFEVSDQELQDEPLQIRIMDYDTYSANDAIGKVYINLNPLLLNPCRSMSGWLPIYDTLHGIRGEINCMVKVNLFSDNNRFRHSSCGVRFFFSDIPNGYKCDAILGFVDELLVNDDPEYQWIDKIRTPRASNEARQTLFTKLSGEVQRKLGLKAEIFGGNAVIGYQQSFDLEGGSGIVGRGIGTAVVLSKLGHEHPANGRQLYHTTTGGHHQHQLGPSSPNHLFHLNNNNNYNSHLHQQQLPLAHHLSNLNSPYHIHPTIHSMADRGGGASGMQYYKSTPVAAGGGVYPYLGERHLVHSVSADFFYEVPTNRNIALKKELSEASVARICAAASQEQLSDTSDLETFVTLRSDNDDNDDNGADDDDETDVDELYLALDDLERANQPSRATSGIGGRGGGNRKRGARQQLTKSLSLMNARELMGRSPMSALSSGMAASSSSRSPSSRSRANLAGYLRKHTQDIEQKLAELARPVSVTSIKSKSAVKLIKLLSTRTKSQQNQQQNGGNTKAATTTTANTNPATTTITIDDTSTTTSKTSRQAKTTPPPATTTSTITSPSKSNNLASSKRRSTNSPSSQSQSTDSNTPSSPAPRPTTATASGSGQPVSAGGTGSGKRRRDRSGPSATVTSSDDALSIIEEKHDDGDDDDNGDDDGIADDDEDAGFGADDSVVHDEATETATDQSSHSRPRSHSGSPRARLLSVGSATSGGGRAARHSRRMIRGKEIDLSGELDEPSTTESQGVSPGGRRVKGVSVSSLDEDESEASRIGCTIESTNDTTPGGGGAGDGLSTAAAEDDSLALSTSSPSSSVLTDETIRAAKDEPSSSSRSSTLTVTASMPHPPRRAQKAATFDETDLMTTPGAEFGTDAPAPGGGQPLNRSESARHHSSKRSAHSANSNHQGNTCGTPEPTTIGSQRHKAASSGAGGQFVSAQQKARIGNANFAQSVGVIKAQQHLLQNMIRHQNENLVWSSMNKARSALVYPGRIHQSEYPFVTLKRFPDGLIQCTGGVVSVHSVKLLDHIINDEESETRDNWWTEIRKEIRSHAKSLNCNTILGYTETSRVLGDVCILSARGTAAILKPLEFQRQTNASLCGAGGHRERTLSSSTNQTAGAHKVRRMSASPPPPQLIASHASMPPAVIAATASSSSSSTAANATTTLAQTVPPDGLGINHPPTAGSSAPREEGSPSGGAASTEGLNEKFRRHSVSLDGQSSQSAALIDCSFAHSPLRCVESIESLSNCAICCSNKVPDVLLLTIEPPKSLNIVSTCSLVQARVCRAKRDSHGEASAKEIGDALPFLEYELHRQLFSKLKFKGMNCLFNLEIDISVGENFLTGLATGTGCFVLGLPTPEAPKISAGKGIKAAKLNEIQRLIALSASKNRDSLGLEQITRQLDEYHRQIGLLVDLSPAPSRPTVGKFGQIRDGSSTGALGAPPECATSTADQDNSHQEPMSVSPSGGTSINSATKKSATAATTSAAGIMQPQLSQGTASTTSQTLSGQLQQQHKQHKHHHHGHHHHHHHRKSPRLGSQRHQQQQAAQLQQDLDTGRPAENLVSMMDDDNNIILEVDDNEDADIIALLIDSDIPSGYMICNSEIVPTIDQGAINSINMFTQVMRVKLNGIDQFAQQFDFILQTLYVKLRRSLPCCLTNLNFVVDLPESYIVQITVTGCLLGLNYPGGGAGGGGGGSVGGVVSSKQPDSNSTPGQQQQPQPPPLDRVASCTGPPVNSTNSTLAASETSALAQGSTIKKKAKKESTSGHSKPTTKASSTSMSPTSTTSATNSSSVSTASGSSGTSSKANNENKRRASNTSTSSSGKAKSSSSSSTSSSSTSSSSSSSTTSSSSSSLSTNESAASHPLDVNTKKHSPGKSTNPKETSLSVAVPASAAGSGDNVKKSSLRSSSRTNLAALISAGRSTLSGDRRSKSKVEIELVERQLELDGVTPSTRATQEAIKHEILSNRLGGGQNQPASSVAKAAAHKLRPVFKKQQTYPGATSPAISGQDNILDSQQQQQQVHLAEFLGGDNHQQHQPSGSGGGSGSSNARKQATALLNKVKQPFKDLGSSFNSSLPLGGSPASQQQQHLGPLEPGTNSASGASSVVITPTNLVTRPAKSRLSGATNSQQQHQQQEQLTAQTRLLTSSNGPASSRCPQNLAHSVTPTSGGTIATSQHTADLQPDQNPKSPPRRSSFASAPPTASAATNKSMTAGGGALEARCFSSSSSLNSSIDITSLSYIPGARDYQYLGNLSFSFVRETNSVRENGGLNGFIHCFLMEVYAIVRAHVSALGGNAFLSFRLQQSCIFYHSNKNQAQCLISVAGDAIQVTL